MSATTQAASTGHVLPVLATLQAAPGRFGFDAALRLLMQATGQGCLSQAARLRCATSLAFPGADIASVTLGEPGATPAQRPTVVLGLPGLAGAGGALPLHYSGLIAEGEGGGLAPLLDMLSHRMLAALAQAGAKYRLERAGEMARLQAPPPAAAPAAAPHSSAEHALLALAGFSGQALLARLGPDRTPLLHYAGLFTHLPRSASRLAALAADWLGLPVRVEEFAGSWLKLGASQQSRLPQGRRPGAFAQLGVDAAIGTRAWDPQARIILHVGPVSRAVFETLLPDQPALQRFNALVAAYLGVRVAFAVTVSVRGTDLPQARLAGGTRLGWNTWLARAGPGPDATDACFESTRIARFGADPRYTKRR